MGIHPNLLITGATGFVGGALAARLLDTDRWNKILFLVRAQHREDGLVRLAHVLRKHDVPERLLDRLHLEQILWNLLRNAWRYCTKQSGSIRIRLSGLADRVDIDIINDGPAIPTETKTRLFEPFYTTSKQGTGLGLYIARDLAEANGGNLSYMDVPDGAMFRLSGTLPPCKESGK